MNSSGIIKVILVVLGLALIAGLVYFFLLSPGNKYNRLVNEANELYEERQYDDAKKLYYEALEIRTDEAYPRQRILTIDSIQQQLVQNIRYDEKINKADLLYSQGKYQEASQYYFDALNVKPDEDYPVNQIKKITELLKDADGESGQDPKAEKQGNGKNFKTTSDGKNFHVVVGVFDNHENALEMLERMKELGKESYLISRPGGLEAVTYDSYDNIHTAYNFLKFVKNDVNENAWVLYHETK